MNYNKLTDYLDHLEEQYGIPSGDCIVCRKHQVLYRHSFGHSDYERKKTVSPDDFYMLYSATKLITMTAVLQLIEHRRLNLYDELTNYFPEFSVLRVVNQFNPTIPMAWPAQNAPSHFAHNTIRIIDLMSMTAGLSYNMDAEPLKELRQKSNNKAGTSEVVACIAKMPLIYEPREHWSYSIGHDILAGVVEKVSGVAFDKYLEQNIFEPLEITDLTFMNSSVRNKLSALYRGELDPVQGPTGKILPYPEGYKSNFCVTENYKSGGAGLIGTVDAYSKIADALANGGIGYNGARILKEETVALFSIPYTTGIQTDEFRMSGKTGYDYGLGVRVLTDAKSSPSPVGEFGWDGAAGAYVLIDPIHKLSIFYVQHIFGFPKVYSEIHPTIRNLVYETFLHKN